MKCTQYLSLLSCSLVDARKNKLTKINGMNNFLCEHMGVFREGDRGIRAQSYSSLYAIVAENKEPGNGRVTCGFPEY